MLSDLKIKENLHYLIRLPINKYDTFIPAFYDSLQVDSKVYQ
jgi:hypothetical protein